MTDMAHPKSSDFALYRRLILLLDEPTSWVDVKKKSVIVAALKRLMAARTTFMIAHRMSIFESCDILLKVDHGRLVSVTTQTDLGPVTSPPQESYARD